MVMKYYTTENAAYAPKGEHRERLMITPTFTFINPEVISRAVYHIGTEEILQT